MPRRFVGSRVFGASSDDVLSIEHDAPNLATVIYEPSADKIEQSQGHRISNQNETWKRKLLEIGGPKRFLSIYPLNTLSTHPEFLQPKYKQIESITLEGFDYEIPESLEEVENILEGLPAGFVKDFSYGLGLVKDYRFIIATIEQIPQIKHLVISMENETGVSDEFYTLSFQDYDSLRKAINRVTAQQQSEGAKDKWILANNSLLTTLDPKNFPEKSRPYRKDTIFKLISSDPANPMTLSVADQDAAIRIVDQNKREIAQKAPQQLLQLRKDIELVTLEVLIAKYEQMLAKDVPEAGWQKLFNDHPFILNLAFGYPVIKIQDQAHVGGQTLSGTGDTITDFLVKNGISNNAALFEIKTPATPLLNKTAYRGQLYTPSSDLAGSINQMLDQKNEFQRDVARIKENSRIYNLESYAVHGVLVIGTMPEGLDQQKSFELFRGNSKDITIVTFDELLAKLKQIHEFLASHAPEAGRASIMHGLETKVLRLQDGLNALYEHSESRSGSIRKVTSKLLPGVDGSSVMATMGKLSILKHGFDRVRLQTPPYPVAFDESGEHTVNVQTLDEFIAEAEKAIADADAVLTAQKRRKL